MKIKDSKELVTVIIVNYNNAKFINRCVKSVINQTYKKIEIIFVDDKSTDKSIYVINKFKKKIKIIRNKSKFFVGAYDQIKSYCNGIKKARGKIIFFLDSDDFFTKDKVDTTIKYFNKYKLKITFDLPYLYFNKKRYSKLRFINRSTFFTPWPKFTCQSCISINKKYLLKIINKLNFNKFPNIWFDFRLALQSLNDFNQVYIIKKYLTFYQQSDVSISSKFKKFSKNWWTRREEAHKYTKKYLRRDKRIMNIDLIFTKLINYLLK